MPIYKNIHPNKNKIDSIKTINNKYVSLPYGKQVETYRYYDNPTELLLIDNSPYWNPVLKTTEIILSDSDDFQVVTLNPETFTVEIINSSDNTIYLFYQSTDNTPYLPIPSGSSRTINHFQNYTTQLIFKSTAATIENEVFVTQFKE